MRYLLFKAVRIQKLPLPCETPVIFRFILFLDRMDCCYGRWCAFNGLFGKILGCKKCKIFCFYKCYSC